MARRAKRAKTPKARKAAAGAARATIRRPRRVAAVPDGCHSVTPYPTVRDGAHAIEFYTRALGAGR
jgi:hypothetical protein